ncbi:MAG: hypothetical protein K0U40_09035 [Betaproteobacteria bacterium]|nr:hypothetical protein [Betaproteobacteria bacterium]
MKKLTLRLLVFLMLFPLLSGCWLAAAAGAGAYGGYKAKEEGYTLRNPVTKQEETKKNTASE